ncbi:MAG: hypothetical protein K6E35_07440 [Bacteroidales bacterium]|nr:hypothetical protein [Bacteroidales bacterium]
MLAYNGYVCVFNYTFPETPEYLIVDELRDNPFDVDWTTYRHTDLLRNIYRNEPDLMKKAAKTLEITDRAIRYTFEKDNGDLARIYSLAECADLGVKLLIKKDEKAAAIVVSRLEKDEI